MDGKMGLLVDIGSESGTGRQAEPARDVASWIYKFYNNFFATFF